MNKIYIVWPLFYMTYFPWITPVSIILHSQFVVVLSNFKTYDSSLWSNLILKKIMTVHSISQSIKNVKNLFFKDITWMWKNNSNGSRLQKSLSYPKSPVSLFRGNHITTVIYPSQDSRCLYKCASISFSVFNTGSHHTYCPFPSYILTFLLIYQWHFSD